MTANNPQVPWTDEQWARVNQVVQEEAARARVAASFLPLYGPLPPDTDFVRSEIIPADEPLRIQDRQTIQLATLEVKVQVRNAQMADSEMTSALALFRRAASVLARLEDAVVFMGLGVNRAGDVFPVGGAVELPQIWGIHGGQQMGGLWERLRAADWRWITVSATGEGLVRTVSDAIGRLEAHGHFGPFAAVLGQALFLVAQTPDEKSLVLPQDRIIPFLGGGPLLRSSALSDIEGFSGVVVALGGAPVELVVATDLSIQFLQVTVDPHYLFRVREKIALRIKEAGAIVRLHAPLPTVTDIRPRAAASPTDVVITGTHFLGARSVKFGESIATIVGGVSDTEITVRPPPHAPGKVHVTVSTPRGSSKETAADLFTYE
jgi:uncharacterized linocin/CFP29 family protein